MYGKNGTLEGDHKGKHAKSKGEIWTKAAGETRKEGGQTLYRDKKEKPAKVSSFEKQAPVVGSVSVNRGGNGWKKED